MNDSILTSVKKALGIQEEYVHFDPEIVLHINSVFMVLTQIGVGPEEGFMIEDKSAKWSDFLGKDRLLEGVKTYMVLRVRLLFDPPQNSSTLDAFTRMADEMAWRSFIKEDTIVEEIQNGG